MNNLSLSSLSIEHHKIKEKNEFIDYLYLSNLNNEVKLKNIMEFGYISYYYSKKDKSVSILHLFIQPSLRNKGYGSLLIKECIKKCKNTYRSKLIFYIDDMSDRYLQQNNIYIKLGFRYISEGDGPEMIAKFD